MQNFLFKLTACYTLQLLPEFCIAFIPEWERAGYGASSRRWWRAGEGCGRHWHRQVGPLPGAGDMGRPMPLHHSFCLPLQASQGAEHASHLHKSLWLWATGFLLPDMNDEWASVCNEFNDQLLLLEVIKTLEQLDWRRWMVEFGASYIPFAPLLSEHSVCPGAIQVTNSGTCHYIMLNSKNLKKLLTPFACSLFGF